MISHFALKMEIATASEYLQYSLHPHGANTEKQIDLSGHGTTDTRHEINKCDAIGTYVLTTACYKHAHGKPFSECFRTALLEKRENASMVWVLMVLTEVW